MTDHGNESDPKLHTDGPMMRGALRELPIDGLAPGVH